jgi:Tfp pilus assembly PilM family ATPase
MALSLRRNTDGGTVGLDIDGRYLAAAQVQDGKLTRLASAELPSGVLADGEVVDRAGLSAAIKEFATEHKLPRQVQLGVSNQQIVVRVLELPRIDDASERDAALRFQAAEAIAMPLDEAVLDHQIAGYVNGADGVERMQVVVVAARRTMIDEYLGAVRDAGLKVEGIDLDAFALVRLLADEAPATFAPIPEPEPIPEPIPAPESFEEPVFGPQPLADPADDELASELPTESIPPEPAPFTPAPAPFAPEPVGDLPPSARVMCHLGGISNLAISIDSSCFFTRTLTATHGGDGAASRHADEIRLSIDYYMAQPNALAIGDVLLSGEGARDAALVAEIGAQLGIPVAAARPLGALEQDAAPDEDPYRYTVAAGLALGAAA